MKRYIIRIAAICLLATLAISPATASAALLRRGSRGSEVQTVQRTLQNKGYFNFHTATGFYGPITETAVRQFQRDNGLIVDGIVGRQTRGALFGTTQVLAATSVNVEAIDPSRKGALDWFTRAQFAWPRGADAVVTDVLTGRSFNMRRTFGSNHADVEPLTVQDANTIREIWGGWSWERRAVVVKINGHVMAASMNGMPHAGLDSAPAGVIVNNRSAGYGRGVNLDAVKGNGVDGHMCIHFRNSRTHGSNRLDQGHQLMVNRAEAYILRNY